MDQQSMTNAASTTIQHQISNGLNDLNVSDEVRVFEPSYNVWNNCEDTDSWRECQHTELPLTGEKWLPLVDYPSSWYEPYFEVAFGAVFRKLMEEWFPWVECMMPRKSLTTITAQWTYACDRFEEDLGAEMLNVLGTGEMAGNNEDILQVLGGDSTVDQLCATEMLPKMSADSMKRVQPRCAECLPSEVHVRRTDDVKKVLHESELDHTPCQHLHDHKKDQKLDDSKKDQELDDLNKGQKSEFLEKFHEWLKDDTPLPRADRVWQMKKMLREVKQYYDMYQHLQDPKKDQQLEDSRKDQDLEDSKKDQELEDSKGLPLFPKRRFKVLLHQGLLWELDDSKKDCDFDDFMKELEIIIILFGHDLMFNHVKTHLLKNELLPKKMECTESNLLRGLQALLDFTENCWRECQHTEPTLTREAWLALVDHFSLSSQYEPYMEGVFSAEMRRMVELCSLAECVNQSTTPRSRMLHAFEDFVAEMRNAFVLDGIAENHEETETGGEDLETVHGEEANSNQQSLKMEQPYYYITKETLKKPSLEKSEKAVQKAIIEKLLLEVVSEANPSEYHNPSDSNSNLAQNVVVNMAESAPVETQRDHLSVDKGLQKATSAGVTKESPDMEDLWDKELSVPEDQVSDMKMPQANAQTVEIYSTVETAQNVLPQPGQVMCALIPDQATDVTIAQMSSLKEAQAIVHPQAAQEVVCQATALQTAFLSPQLNQAVALQMPQVLTVQTVPLCDPPQSDVLALVTAAQMLEAPQARALPVAQACTFEAAPESAPAAIYVGCTFETDLVLAPQAAQVCALEVEVCATLQTGQVSVFSSSVTAYTVGDGVVPICIADSLSQAETSHYTDCTVLPTSDELSHSTASQFPQSAPPQIVIDDVVLQQKCKVDVQHISRLSDSPSSECEHVPQQEEAGNDGATGDGSVAPDPFTASPSEMLVTSSVSMFARNMVGWPTPYTCMTEEQQNNGPVTEDSEERKKKAMGRLRKEREERLKQNAAAVKKTSDTSHAVTKGLVLLSNVHHIFQEGAYVPLPSQEAMAKVIGKGGNGVVAFIYHGGREFAVKETGLRQEELAILSSVNHHNVIEICAVLEGDWDSACPGARRCYQMMPRITGDVKRLLVEKERPTLCHYFFDFKEDSERAGLVLGNAKYILLGVLNGLKHLHSLGIMHRDIKLQNILVNHHCQCRDIFLCPHDGDSGYGVFISDFDSAQQVERGRQKLERTKLHGRPIEYTVHGTDGYRPPETSFPMYCNEVLPEWISLKTDIWSFGAMVVKFFVGSRGPHSQREMATLLLADCLQSPTAHGPLLLTMGQREVRMADQGSVTSPLRQALAVEPNEMKTLQKVALLEKYFPLATDLHQLVQFCLTVNVEERPNVQQVMEHAFFRPFTSDSRDTSMPDTDGRRGVGGEQSTSGLVACSNEGKSLS